MAASGKLAFSERIFMCFEQMQQAIEERDSRHMTKVLRNITILRKVMRVNDHSSNIIGVISAINAESTVLAKAQSNLAATSNETTSVLPEKLNVSQCLPEIEAFIGFLVAGHLTDKKKYTEAIELLRFFIDIAKDKNRRSLDVLLANSYALLDVVLTAANQNPAQLRGELLLAHRAATQTHSFVAQSIYINLIIRSYIEHASLYDQAQKFLDKCTYPDNQRASSQHARFLYYQGKIRAIQLLYSESLSALNLALRKAPAAVSSKIETAKASLTEKRDSVKEKIRKAEEEALLKKKNERREKERAEKNMSKEEREAAEKKAKEDEAKKVADEKAKKEREAKGESIMDVETEAKKELTPEEIILKNNKISVTTAGLGFRLAIRKLAIVVELLSGEIPSRRIFDEPSEKVALAPYLALVEAVKEGSIGAFQAAFEKYSASVYRVDGLLSLVGRLRHAVVRSGLRHIAATYMRISLVDCAEKLGFGASNVFDAESVIKRAIADGVIDARIDRAKGHLVSHNSADIYSTKLPQAQLHRRTIFCMQLYDDAVKALVYADDKANGKDKEADEEAKRMAELEAEAREQAENGDFDDLYDDDDF